MLRLSFLTPIFCGILSAAWAFDIAAAENTLMTIDGDSVTYAEYEQFAYNESRQTYYHGKPPEGPAMIEFRQEVAQKLVDRKLKVGEALRRGLKADDAKVDAQLARYEQQYGDTPRWQAQGTEMLARLRAYFEEEDLVEQLDTRLRVAPEPSDEQVEGYYRANIDKFTEPEKVRVSVILLAVPPWSDESAWTAARDEVDALAESIRGGMPFAEAARLHSADPTADNGGDMGYLHVGALNQAVQNTVNALQPGEMSPDPVTVLEGVVLVRLEDRQVAQVHEFTAVRERAEGLWRRDAAERAYATALEELRADADVWLDEEYLRALPN